MAIITPDSNVIPHIPGGTYTLIPKEQAPALPTQTRIWNMMQMIVTFPMQVASYLYNLVFSLGAQQRSTFLSSSPVFGKELFKHFRNDPEQGLFTAASHYQILLRTIFPNEKGTADDILLSCHAKFVGNYRNPILHFVGSANIKQYQSVLESCSKEILDEYLAAFPDNKIDAADLAQVYTTAMVAKLFFGLPGTVETYREIAKAISLITNGPRKEEESDCTPAMLRRAIATLQKVAEDCMTPSDTPRFGSLVQHVRNKEKLTELQIRALILTIFIAGSETSATMFSGLLYELGHNADFQNEIFTEMNKEKGSALEKAKNSPAMSQLFTESMRRYAPSFSVERVAAKNLVCIGKDSSGKEIFRQELPKGTSIRYDIYSATRDIIEAPVTDVFFNHHVFNPQRHDPRDTSLPWLPFGAGKHACPGQELARAEVYALVAHLLEKYEIKSLGELPFPCIAHTTRRMECEIPLTLTKRADPATSPSQPPPGA